MPGTMNVYRCSTTQRLCYVCARSAKSAARKGEKRLGREVTVQAWSSRLSDLMPEAWKLLSLKDRFRVVVMENARIKREVEYLEIQALMQLIEHGQR